MYKNKIDKLGFQWIDIETGLRYLNQNMKLYLKVLENFLTRYQSLDIDRLSPKELKENLHSIKGLSATLGMTALAKASTRLYGSVNEIEVKLFKEAFLNTIKELTLLVHSESSTFSVTHTILVLDDNIDDIDRVVEILDDEYDILVALDMDNAISILKNEAVDIVLVTISMVDNRGFDTLENLVQEDTIIYGVESKNDYGNRCYITKPYQQDELIDCLNTQVKLKKIINML